MPYELQFTGVPVASLMIRENGSMAGFTPITPVRDAVHLIQDCDLVRTLVNTLIPSTQECSHRVLNVSANVDGRGLSVSFQNQPKTGDDLMMGAFGLGAVSGAATGKTTFSLPVPSNAFVMSVEFAPNATPRRLIAGTGGLPITTYFIGLSRVGVYQVDFPVPPLPVGTPSCDGKKIRSNATITLAGPNSFDGVRLSIQ